MHRLFSRAAPAVRLPPGIWPRDQIELVLKAKYGQLSEPTLREQFVVYGAIDAGILFVIILYHAPGKSNEINAISLYANFSGFQVDRARIAEINRKLAISVAELDEDGAIDLFTGFEFTGRFSEKALSAALDNWRRDVMSVAHALSERTGVAASLGITGDDAIRRMSANRAAIGPDGTPEDLFARFAKPERMLSSCKNCNGHGRVRSGVFFRQCDACGGEGFVETQRTPRA